MKESVVVLESLALTVHIDWNIGVPQCTGHVIPHNISAEQRF